MKLSSYEDAPEEGVSHDPAIRKRVLLRRGDVAHLTNVSRARLEPGQGTVAHSHADMTEVFVVLAGEGVLRVGGVEHALREGACAVVEPGERHELENAGDGPLELLYFGVEA